MTADALLLHAPALLIAVPLLAAFATPLVSKSGSRVRNLWVVFALVFSEAVAIILSLDVLAAGTHVYTVGAEIPSIASPAGFPIRIILVADALSGIVSLLAISISLLVAVYCWHFMQPYKGLEKFYTLLLLLAGSIAGLALTGDFFTLFVFLEIVSVSSASLVAFSGRGESFEAAFKYMVVSALAALFLLFGVGLLYAQYGMLNIAAVASAAATDFSFVNTAALSLILGGLLMKAGSFPVHMWKPDAYQEAPAPIVAVLLMGALACLYVLFRTAFSVFASAAMYSTFGLAIVSLAVLSIFIGASMALKQNNLKRLMGYSAVAEVGYVMLGVGTALIVMPNVQGFALNALNGGIFHLINDALDLSLLFLVIGAVVYVTQKSDVDDLGGLGHRFPALAVLFLVGTLAIAGMPPFNGFASKLLIYESVYYFNPILAIVAIVGSIMLLAVFVKAFTAVFLGVPFNGEVKPLPKSMLAVMAVLALLIITFGLFPSLAIDSFVARAAEALSNPSMYIGGVL